MQETKTSQHSTEEQAQYRRAGKGLTINFRTCSEANDRQMNIGQKKGK